MKKTAVGLCVIGCLAGTMAWGVPNTAKWITVFSQNFDGFTPTSGKDWYGDGSTQEALWGSFDPDDGKDGRLSTNRAYSGTQSMRVWTNDVPWPTDVFGGITDTNYIGSGEGYAKQFELSFKLYRDGDSAGVIGWSHVEGGVTNLSHDHAGSLYPQPRARFQVYTGTGSTAYFNGENWELVVYPDNWRECRFVYDLTEGNYGRVYGYVAAYPGGEETYMGYVDFTEPFLEKSNRMAFYAGDGAEGSMNYFDDIKLTIAPPKGTIVVIR